MAKKNFIQLIADAHIWGPKYPSGFMSLNGHRQWLGAQPSEISQNNCKDKQ